MGRKVVIVYKGLTGEAERSPDDNMYHGAIIGISQEVHYKGASISDLQLSFTRAVDAFLGDSSRPSLSGGVIGRKDRAAGASLDSV